jgi:hypothetical protein
MGAKRQEAVQAQAHQEELYAANITNATPTQNNQGTKDT